MRYPKRNIVKYHRAPDGVAAALVFMLGVMLVVAWLAGCGWQEADAEASDPVVRPLRTEQVTTTTTSTTTTTVPPTTTTTAAPTTTVPPEAPQEPVEAPEAAPAPAPTPAPSIDLWACSTGLAKSISVIPGGTSWARTDGTVLIDQWAVDQGQDTVCSKVAHEEGHLYAYWNGPATYLGEPPTAFYSRDVEHWADCYAAVMTGWDRQGRCGAAGIASAAAIL